ncbi:MAG: substrate-binding domain-containing protein [Verrucomicrobia bacterium]|nr:substrate-binding domain-containing protein [Verrucomicrobiota bacterium]MCH8526256.1 substrate-binding domain-containing protein [Kiritimatiellia bacterium]
MSGLDAEILRGIQEYAHNYNWQLFNANSEWGIEQVEGNAELIHGVIAVVADAERAEWLRTLNCPAVNVSNTFPETYGFPAVLSQDSRVGELAAEYFQERGYSNFAAYFLPGDHPYRYINTRAAAFARTVKARGRICHGILDVYPEERAARLKAEGWEMKTLRDLPKPCGIFCIDDQQGSYISFMALSRGLRIPSEVGVLGGDNFQLYCNMSNPPLSSVDLDGPQIGRTAAETLQRFMSDGKPAPYELIEVPPRGVVSRATVDTSAIQNPLLARTRQYILEHSHERINVSDIVRAVRTSRRKLETLYQAELGLSLLQSLNQARIDHSRRLLQDTDLPLYKIAGLCGFRDTHQMNRVFTRHGAPSPKEIRKNTP